MSNVGILLSRLDKVRQRSRDSWIACCPAHEDRSPSMSIRDADGKILIHCFAGCEVQSILDSVGVTMTDLFPEPLPNSGSMRRPFPAADVLECLAMETKIVAFTADRVSKNLPVSATELSRLKVAMFRIEEGRSLANG